MPGIPEIWHKEQNGTVGGGGFCFHPLKIITRKVHLVVDEDRCKKKKKNQGQH